MAGSSRVILPQIYRRTLDVGDRRTRYAVLDSDGKVFEEDQFKTDRHTTLEFAKHCRGARVILEVGAHSRWMSQIFEAESNEVCVANARQIQLIYASVDKDDRLDAMRLAKLGRRRGVAQTDSASNRRFSSRFGGLESQGSARSNESIRCEPYSGSSKIVWIEAA